MCDKKNDKNDNQQQQRQPDIKPLDKVKHSGKENIYYDKIPDEKPEKESEYL